MCGIIKTKNKKKLDAISHRGIQSKRMQLEGTDYWLCHHRLPIQTSPVDIWGQPLILDNGLIVMFVGEIFNFPKKYPNDVAYIKELFESEKLMEIFEQSINTWDGFWAIHIEDTINGLSYSFTDPLGKKQLYYNEEGEVCSEITPLVHDFEDHNRLYRAHVEKNGYSVSNMTPWNHVSRVMPQEIVIHQGRYATRSISEYKWSWESEGGEDLYFLMYEAVDRRAKMIDSATSRGILLSGGLDSSIIAAMTKETGNDKAFKFFTIENGETSYANMMADHMGVDLSYLAMKQEPKEDLEKILLYNEVPVDLGSLIPQHYLIEAARKNTVILTGDGADELFGGYTRAKTYDSQLSDVFEELPFYHLPRLDRASMRYLTELRSPFLSFDIIRFALDLDRQDRIGKKILKDVFGSLLPNSIVTREKLPLKHGDVVKTPALHRRKIIDLFYGLDWSKKLGLALNR